jgi:hypothetical protein
MKEQREERLLSVRNTRFALKHNTTLTTGHLSFEALSICADPFLLNYLKHEFNIKHKV